MSLYYASMRTRPDILVHLTFLASRIQDCRDSDRVKLDRVIRYVLLTRTRGIVLRTRGTRLIFSIDASFAVHTNGRSHSGLHVTLGTDGSPPDHYGGPIVVRSHVQKLVTLSSCEAELNAVHQYQHQFHYLRSLMVDFGFDQTLPSIVLQDNAATITLLNRGDSTNVRNAHFKVRIHFSKQLITNNTIILQWCPTDIMPADPPSKPMHALVDMPKLLRLTNDEVTTISK